MRRLTIDEGAGTVDVRHGRAHVRHHGQYLGPLHRDRAGWSHPCRPQARFTGPVEAAEDMILMAVLP